MKRAVVCDQWVVTFPESARQAWFLQWLIRNPKIMSKHLAAGFNAYASLTDFIDLRIGDVVEYFGGAGLQALMIQQMFRPANHIIYDNARDAVDYLTERWKPAAGVRVQSGDVFRVAGVDAADMVAFDAGDLTIHRATTDYRPVLDAIFQRAPQAVVLTDIAGTRFPVNRERYSQILGGELRSYPEYLLAVGDWFMREFNYQTHACFHYTQGAVFALVQGDERTSRVFEIPKTEEGFRWE